MPSIFLNYRRKDSSGHVGRLHDRLKAKLPDVEIFMDIDKILPGEDFTKKIQVTAGACDILLAIIGPQWLTITDPTSRPRIFNPHDWVRREIAVALARGIPLIPVLVEGAHMPRSGDLPAALGPLADRQGLELTDSRYDLDVNQLFSSINNYFSFPRQKDLKSLIDASKEDWRSTDSDRSEKAFHTLARLGPDVGATVRKELFDSLGAGGSYAFPDLLDALNDDDQAFLVIVVSAINNIARFDKGKLGYVGKKVLPALRDLENRVAEGVYHDKDGNIVLGTKGDIEEDLMFEIMNVRATLGDDLYDRDGGFTIK